MFCKAIKVYKRTSFVVMCTSTCNGLCSAGATFNNDKMQLVKTLDALRFAAIAFERVLIISLNPEILRIEGSFGVECGGIVSSFDFNGVIARAEPSWRHALAFRVTHIAVSDTLVEIVTVFSPERFREKCG